MSRILLVAGLGNPGNEYEHTRHNAGAWFVSALAKECGISLRLESRFKGQCAKMTVGAQECWLLFPSTYMNHSGEALLAMSQYYRISPQQILVAHDELDLPLGSCKLKQGGGHAGHNGLRDIIQRLGTPDFLRLRIGIGHPGHREKVLGYVLGTPSKADKELIDVAIAEAAGLIPCLVKGDIEMAMQQLHSA